jgi:hypothetical protein
MTIISDAHRDMWNYATSNLPWGLQRALLDALELCEQGKIKLVYGRDHYDGVPCLVNAVSNMTTQGTTSPASYAQDVVTAFDAINRVTSKAFNWDSNFVDPITAGWLIRNFGPLNPEPKLTPLNAMEFLDDCEGLTSDDASCLSAWIATITQEAENGSASNV